MSSVLKYMALQQINLHVL